MENKKLIDLYKEWMETGFIKESKDRKTGCGGLCNALPIKYLSSLQNFVPEDGGVFWANKMDKAHYTTIESMYAFNELRQHIVLLICAIHNEL